MKTKMIGINKKEELNQIVIRELGTESEYDFCKCVERERERMCVCV